MRKLTIRDALATVLVAAVLVPYVGYLWQGEMPFIKDPRGMAATALILGAAAFVVAGVMSDRDRFARIEVGLAAVVAIFGVVVVVLAETAAAEALLAALVAGVVAVWVMQMLHHAGYLGPRGPAVRHR